MLKLVSVSLVLTVLVPYMHGALLGVYEFSGDPPNPAVTAQPSGATFGSMTRNNVTYDSELDRFSSVDWSHDSTPDLTRYVQFVLTPNAGQQLNLTAIQFLARIDRGTELGPRDIRASIFIGANTTPQASMDFSPSGHALNPFSFDFADFSTASSVTVRFYGWDVPNNKNGPLALDNVATEGSITPVPEPTLAALMLFSCAWLSATFCRRLRKRR